MISTVSLSEKLRWRLKVVEHKYLQYRSTTNETVIAETEYGKIKGVKRMSIYNKPYYSFEGIPYAQPPVGELRFKSPQRPTPWEDIKDCTKTKDKPVQLNYICDKIEGSEDCLYLNVYTNDPTPDLPRPVMVWIHGGGFVTGEATREFFGPDYFISRDVILINFQHRLGVLGFLSLNDPSLFVPGNAGLKDQVMALKWIKNNCSYFGGNPDCITVFGQSAGAASTHYLSMTEQTQGLFHRSILMSGCAMAPWAHNNCQDRAYTLAKLSGYLGENNDADVLKFLMTAKPKELARVEEQVLSIDEHMYRIMFPFGPTVEPYETPDCVIPKHPREMMKTAWGNSIPTLIGYTSSEGLIFLPETRLMPAVVEDLDSCINFVPHELRGDETYSALLFANGLRIKRAHVPREVEPNTEMYFDLCSVMHFLFPMHRMLQARLKYAGDTAPVYIYRFDFDSDDLIYPYRIMRWGRGISGVAHGDELAYLFSSLLARRLPKDTREYRTIQRMIAIWTKFAIDGTPHDPKINGMEHVIWEPVKKSDEVYKVMNISDDFKFIELPEDEKIQRWSSMYAKRKSLFY